MWKLLKLIGRLVKATLMLALVLFLGGLLCLYVAEQGLPNALVQKITERISSDELVCRIERITYSLRHGLTVHTFKAFPQRVTEGALVSAEEVNVDFVLLSFMPMRDRVKRVTVKGLDFPALPPRPPRDPDAPKPPPVPREINVTLPEVSPFELVLENANILGLKPERLTATVASTASQASVTRLRAAWPERAGEMHVTGDVSFDPDTKRIFGNAQGKAFPHLITPFLLNLRAKGVVTQIDCFQDFQSPIAVNYTIDLELTKVDYAMVIDVEAADCTYRGVPVSQMKGLITVTDTNNLVIADIDLSRGEFKDGSLTGRLLYRDDTDELFIDAQGAMPKTNLLTIINVLNHGELDHIQSETPIVASVKGVVATNPRKACATNDLNATLSFAKGNILRIPLTDVSCDLKMYAYSACVDNIKGTPAGGGQVEGFVHFAFPEYSASNTTFVAQVSADRANFSSIMCIGMPTNTFTGTVTGRISLNGTAAGNVLASMDGTGTLRVDDSMLARMPLFAGLTDWLARNIPGISSVVNQSSAKLDFVMTNGVAVTENMVVEGNVFSILLKGSYTLETNAVDMAVRVNILREGSVAAWLTRIITVPITRVLLEFKLSGTATSPEWSYVTFVEKLIDAIF